MNTIWTRRIGAASGAVYVVLGLLNGGGGNEPSFHASHQAIIAWIRSTPRTITPAHYVMGLVELLSLLCLVLFVAYLASVLRQAEGVSTFLPGVVIGGGVLAVAIKIASFPPALVANVWAHDGVDPRVLGMLLDMNTVSFDLFQAAIALSIAAVAAGAIATRALPRWLSWGTAVTALALFANVAFAYKTADFAPAVLLFLLWSLVTSIVLVRRAGAGAEPFAFPQMPDTVLAH